jgi:hypothetical protein
MHIIYVFAVVITNHSAITQQQRLNKSTIARSDMRV